MRSWILLGKEDSEREFWSKVYFPRNYWGDSAYEVRYGRRSCKRDYDCFFEKSAFWIYYNPWTDKFRVYVSRRLPKSVKVIDPDYLSVYDEKFLYKIERYCINGQDFLDRLIICE